MIKKICTWANFFTIVSLACGAIAYRWCGDVMGDASMITGTVAFLVGLA